MFLVAHVNTVDWKPSLFALQLLPVTLLPVWVLLIILLQTRLWHQLTAEVVVVVAAVGQWAWWRWPWRAWMCW